MSVLNLRYYVPPTLTKGFVPGLVFCSVSVEETMMSKLQRVAVNNCMCCLLVFGIQNFFCFFKNFSVFFIIWKQRDVSLCVDKHRVNSRRLLLEASFIVLLHAIWLTISYRQQTTVWQGYHCPNRKQTWITDFLESQKHENRLYRLFFYLFILYYHRMQNICL